MTDFYRHELQALKIPCAYCAARPGEICRTSSGVQATYPHVQRVEPIREAFMAGVRYHRRVTEWQEVQP